MKNQTLANTINRFSVIPLILLPFVYWSIVQLQQFKEWYIIPLLSIPIGIFLGIILSKLIEIKYPGISKVKNKKDTKLVHYTSFIGLLVTLITLTFLNVSFPTNSETKRYDINLIGRHGVGKNKKSFVEIKHVNGDLEKFNFNESFINGMKNKKSIVLIKNTTIFGLTFHSPEATNE